MFLYGLKTDSTILCVVHGYMNFINFKGMKRNDKHKGKCRSYFDLGREGERKQKGFTRSAKSIGNMSALSWDICSWTCLMLIFTPFLTSLLLISEII